MQKLLLTLLCGVAATVQSSAALLEFDIGPENGDGAGMHGGNLFSPRPNSGGTGGEWDEGISYDTELKVLRLLLAWGTDYGFKDLTGEIVNLRIGIYTIPGLPGEDLYEYNAGDPAFNGTDSDGRFVLDLHLVNKPVGSSYTIADQESYLNDGKWYVNVRTSAYSAGEIEGRLSLAPVPEPASWGMAAGSLLLVVGIVRTFRHRRR